METVVYRYRPIGGFGGLRKATSHCMVACKTTAHGLQTVVDVCTSCLLPVGGINMTCSDCGGVLHFDIGQCRFSTGLCSDCYNDLGEL